MATVSTGELHSGDIVLSPQGERYNVYDTKKLDMGWVVEVQRLHDDGNVEPIRTLNVGMLMTWNRVHAQAYP